MKRSERQELIKRLIAEEVLATQEDLKSRLVEQGVQVTQATLSRDIRDMGLLKLAMGRGKRQYVLPETLPKSFSTAVYDLVLGVSRADFMLVVKTELGNADVLANIIDAEKKADVLGTVAGADTLLIICQDKDAAAAYEASLGKSVR